jgi:hypothetical protein
MSVGLEAHALLGQADDDGDELIVFQAFDCHGFLPVWLEQNGDGHPERPPEKDETEEIPQRSEAVNFLMGH